MLRELVKRAESLDEVFAICQDALSTDEMLSLLYMWDFWARKEQLAPTHREWTVWALIAGRGFGKTRTGAEWIIKRQKNGAKRIAIVAETAADARDVMVEGEAGILACAPPWNTPIYMPSKRRLEWPNGAVAFTYSAEEPDQLRGPAHDTAWCDEIAKWRYPDTWDQLMFGLRLGSNPQVVVTTTPRPIKLIRDLLADPDTVVTRGSTYDNAANLAKAFFDRVIRRYEGTRMGRQELRAEILDDVPGALWSRDVIDALRRKPLQIATSEEVEKYGIEKAVAQHMRRITVNIDPAVTSGENADETGLTVTSLGHDMHGYVLADESGRYPPNDWAMKAIALFKRFDADLVIGETNNGGEMIGNTIHAIDPDIPFKAVTASRGKVTRAEPISAKYEQRQVHHLGAFAELEDQMCVFTTDFDRKKAGFSPDRMDSMVWGFTELLVSDDDGQAIHTFYKRQAAKQADSDSEKTKVKNEERIKMKAPANVSTWFSPAGHKINSDGKGMALIPASQVKSAQRAGYQLMTE